MKKNLLSILVLFCLCWLNPLVGQKEYSIEFQVKSKDGKALPNAIINFPELEGENTFVTDDEGKKTIPGLKENQKYSFTIEHDGFKTEQYNRKLSSKSTILFELVDNNSVDDGTTPIQIITNEQLNRSPNLNLGQVLNFYIPSFNAVPQTIADLSDHIVPSTMKGLSPDQFLVLIDKHRRHTSSVVNVNRSVGRGGVSNDLNSIPLAMIESIEIYPASASVRYGSDAIAGIINIKLKTSVGEIKKPIVNFSTHTGSPLDGKYGNRQDGQGRQINFSVALPLKTDISKNGSLLIGGEYTLLSALNRSGEYDASGGIFFKNNPTKDQAKIDSRSFWQKTGLYGKTLLEAGRAETVDKSGFFNLQMPLNENKGVFFANGHINQRQGNSVGFYRLPLETSKVDTTLYPDGFLPRIKPIITDAYVSSGFRGSVKKLKYELAMTNSNSSTSVNLENTLNASLGNLSSTIFQAGKFNYGQNVLEFNVSRPIVKNFDINAGLLFRRESYKISKGEPQSYVTGSIRGADAGSQVFPGLSPENQLKEFRNNGGIYAEGYLRLMDNRLKLKFGGRYEYYKGSGLTKAFNQPNGMLSIAYSMVDEKISLNLSYNGGFKAPSLAQTFFNSSSTQTTGGIAKRVFTANVNSEIRSLLGFPALEPEKAHNFNLGVETKIEKFKFSINAFYILIQNRIALSGQLGNDAANKNQILRSALNKTGISELQLFLNAAQTNTLGLEGSLNWSTRNNIFKPSINWFFNFINKVKRIEGDSLAELTSIPQNLAGLNPYIFNREEISRLEFQQPRFKVLLELPFRAKIDKKNTEIEATARLSVIGKVIYKSPGNETTSQDQNYPCRALVDLRMGLLTNGGKFSIFVGCNNVGDVFPKENVGKNLDFNRFLYSRRSPQFDLTGRYFYTGLRLNL